MVGYYWPCSSRMASGTRIVPMLVQSCLDAFLATVWKLRTAPAPLPESCSVVSSRLGLRAVRSQRPYRLVVRICPSAHVPHDPRVVSFSGSTYPSFFYILRRPRAENLPFVLLHCYTTTSLHDCCYVHYRIRIVG